MKINRRNLLKSSAVIGSLATAPLAARAINAPALTLFDSRLPASRAFAGFVGGLKIDIADEDSRMWRTLRNARKNGRVEGLTSWSDWVLVRGLLEERGLRVKQEKPTGKLFRWTMA
jgi:hypothetical protein